MRFWIGFLCPLRVHSVLQTVSWNLDLEATLGPKPIIDLHESLFHTVDSLLLIVLDGDTVSHN